MNNAIRNAMDNALCDTKHRVTNSDTDETELVFGNSLNAAHVRYAMRRNGETEICDILL